MGVAHHDEDQVGNLPQCVVLPERLHKGRDVLLRIWPAHGEDHRLAGIPQESCNLL